MQTMSSKNNMEHPLSHRACEINYLIKQADIVPVLSCIQLFKIFSIYVLWNFSVMNKCKDISNIIWLTN